ncbi:MAG: hypothetical protein J6V42_01850 [Clostridia bacterium]|nr:hypothetical protein [Clostridia bacterium]
MKKFIALFLVIVMALTCVLVACKKTPEPIDDGDIDGEEGGFNGGGMTTTTTTKKPTGNTASDFTWTDDAQGSLVYVIVDGVSVRSDTNTSDDTFRHRANFGESYQRIKYNENWTLINYKGTEYYISSKYVTTDNGYITFTNDAEETTVYVTAASLALRTNTYTETGYDDNIKTYVNKDAALTRVATSANGKWIKVRVTYTPYGATEEVTEVLCCKAEFVSATLGGESSETPVRPLG